jgi:hypothetical protein
VTGSVNPLPAAGATGLTDAQLRATPVPVSGTVATTATDGALATVGTTTDAEAAGNGTLVALLKRLRTLLAGGLPAALAANGGMKVEGVAGGVAQPVSGTVTANAGTGPFPVSDNAGSLTVDSPVGTPTFVRLSDGAAAITNLAVNNTQIAGTAMSVNNGTVDAGTQRVTLASNGTGVVGLAAGAATIGALTANQSVNVAQIAGTAASTGSRVTDAGVLSVFQAAPASANILVGHVAHTATTAAATIITIGAGKTWVGTITVTANVYNTAVTGTTAGQAQGLIATTGANTVPAPATVVSCEARVGANTATIGGGVGDAVTVTVPMVVTTGASGATITLASTIAGTGGRVAAMCSGYLI